MHATLKKTHGMRSKLVFNERSIGFCVRARLTSRRHFALTSPPSRFAREIRTQTSAKSRNARPTPIQHANPTASARPLYIPVDKEPAATKPAKSTSLFYFSFLLCLLSIRPCVWALHGRTPFVSATPRSQNVLRRLSLLHF